MVWSTMKRLVREDDGMEMVEWSIVGVVFALAGAILWTTLGGSVSNALQKIITCIDTGTCAAVGGGGPTGP